jgi:hypothetical protein
MKKLSIVLAISALVILAVSCAKDVILQPPASLQGEYHGLYSFTKNYSGSAGSPQTLTVPITKWIFTETGYNMKVDTTGDVAFCSPFGHYTLSDRVELDQDINGSGCSGTVADATLNPEGDFTLRRPPDSVILTQVNDTKDAFIEIKLERVTQ